MVINFQKSVKHDSISLKIVEGNNWVRLSAGRSGWKITGRGEMRLAEKVKCLFEDALRLKKPYGEAIAYVESGLV